MRTKAISTIAPKVAPPHVHLSVFSSGQLTHEGVLLELLLGVAARIPLRF